MADHADYSTDVAVAMFLGSTRNARDYVVVPASDEGCIIDRIAVLGPSGGVLDGIAIDSVISLRSEIRTRRVMRENRVIWNHEGVLNYR